jgi:hypothetical protein
MLFLRFAGLMQVGIHEEENAGKMLATGRQMQKDFPMA